MVSFAFRKMSNHDLRLVARKILLIADIFMKTFQEVTFSFRTITYNKSLVTICGFNILVVHTVIFVSQVEDNSCFRLVDVYSYTK